MVPDHDCLVSASWSYANCRSGRSMSRWHRRVRVPDRPADEKCQQQRGSGRSRAASSCDTISRQDEPGDYQKSPNPTRPRVERLTTPEAVPLPVIEFEQGNTWGVVGSSAAVCARRQVKVAITKDSKASVGRGRSRSLLDQADPSYRWKRNTDPVRSVSRRGISLVASALPILLEMVPNHGGPQWPECRR